jgi:hypothetical protein
VFAIGPAALILVVFYYLSGVGIRVRSRFAAVTVFVMFLLNLLPEARSIQPIFFVKLVVLAVLGTNIRATFLAAKWAETQTEPPPAPISGSFMDNFGDLWPRRIWPIGQYVYYVMTALIALLLILGIVAVLLGPVLARYK